MFHELLNAEKFVDVTLACENNSLKCHKVRLVDVADYVALLLILPSVFPVGRVISMLHVFPKTLNREPM